MCVVIHTHACRSSMYNSQYLPDKCLEAAPCLYQQAYPAPSNWFLIAALTQRNSYSSVGQGSEPGHQLCQELRKHWKNARDMSKGHRSQAEDGASYLPSQYSGCWGRRKASARPAGLHTETLSQQTKAPSTQKADAWKFLSSTQWVPDQPAVWASWEPISKRK